MKNSFKYLIGLFCVALASNVFSYADDLYVPLITGELTHNYHPSTLDIERLFKEKLQLNNTMIIYTKVPRGLVISIDSSVFFEKGKDKLLESSKPILKLLSEVIISLPNDCVVEGNVVSMGKSDYSDNWELSTVRAEKIVDYLIKTHQVNPQKIDAVGFGEFMPFEDNVDYRGNLENRIDFVIINYEKIKPLD